MSQQTREVIADGAAVVSRPAGVVGAVATSIATTGSVQTKPIAGATAVGATLIGIAADGIEQLARPDTGQTVLNLIGTTGNEAADKIAPVLTPLQMKPSSH